MTNREYLAAKHSLAEEPIVLPSDCGIHEAEALVVAGNWFGAADAYSRIESAVRSDLNPIDRARLLARSATYFDIAGRNVAAARVYSDAARALSTMAGQEQAAGELYNRSAHCHQLAGDYFSAGTTWMNAARAFEKLGTANVRSIDNILPVPASAAGLTIAGSCHNAAGESFLRTSGTERNWATMAFWLAGQSYSRTFPSPNIQTVWSYKAALENGIRQYGSVLPSRTAVYLPLSEEERAAGIDALETMEEALYKSHLAHLELNGAKAAARAARLKTDEEMAATFREFAMLLSSLGHTEASHFRILAYRRIEAIHRRKRRLGRWMLHSAWRITSNYGESLQRWLLCTISVIFAFAACYELSASAEPTASFWDNLYFSIVTFTSLGYGDIQPVGLLGRALASVEIISGLIFFGILLTFLNHRINRS